MKDRRNIQTMDEISTPNCVGIRLRTGTNNGSVGHTMALNGNWEVSVFGYQEIIVRLRKSKFITLINKSSRGFTMKTTSKLESDSAATATNGRARLLTTNADVRATGILLIVYNGSNFLLLLGDDDEN